jgi:hypothetical protein
MNEHIKEDERRTYLECLVRCVEKNDIKSIHWHVYHSYINSFFFLVILNKFYFE